MNGSSNLPAAIGGMLVSINAGSYIAQLYVGYSGNAYSRGKNNGTWSSWKTLS